MRVCVCLRRAAQADWCSSPAVKALANDPATKPLYTLFSAVLSGDLQSEYNIGSVRTGHTHTHTLARAHTHTQARAPCHCVVQAWPHTRRAPGCHIVLISAAQLCMCSLCVCVQYVSVVTERCCALLRACAGFKSAAVASALEAANTTQEAAISKARLVALLTLCSKSQEVRLCGVT